MIPSELEKQVLQKFHARKVFTVDQLKSLLHCSVPTVRNRLKIWGTLTSYNHNGMYYTLAGIPQFDEHGLWGYKNIRFSRFGTLKETVIQLVGNSPQGLNSAELGELLGLDPRSFMNHYKDLPALQREKFQGRYIYLSADEQVGSAQRALRKEALEQQSLQQISDHDALWVFADFIKHPQAPLEKRVARLERQGVSVKANEITTLLQMHGLSEKNGSAGFLKAFSAHRERIIMSTGNQQVFANSPIVTFSAENTVCPSCHGRMKVLKTRERNLALYSVGTITAHETVYSCPVCGYMAPSQELASLAPPRNTFGYDVMIYIGEAVFRHARNEREIRAHLQERGISISASEVGLLADKYICYLACAHRETTAALRTHMQGQGGYILHLDGTCEADSPHLFVGLDEISSFVLDSVKLPSEKKEAIVPFLQELELAYGKPVALVHDMGPGILSAVKEVFPEAPDFICHFHFLRDIGKDLFQREHDHLRSRLRCHGVQGKLRKVLRQCQITQEICTEELETLGATIESEQKSTDSCSEEFLLYTLIHWALAGKAEGDGYGFPFDRPYMTFLTRLYKLRDTINKMKLHQRLPLANTVLAVLRPMWYDQQLITAHKRLKKKITVFDQLRVAMGIAEPAGKLGLNDPGSGAIHTIEARVKKFHHQLVEDDELQEIGYQKMRQQLEKYWEKLFADPIIVTSRGEPLTLTPQRTNNILEKFFRDMKHHHCRKSGYAAMNKSLTAMLSTTPLVKNLDNPEYYKLLLNGSHSLAERFSQVDVTTIQKMFSAEKESVQRVNPRIKKLIKDPKLPNRLMAMVRSA